MLWVYLLRKFCHTFRLDVLNDLNSGNGKAVVEAK